MQFGGLDLQFAGSSAAAVAAAAAANGTNAASSSDAFEFNGSAGSVAAAATSVASVSAAPVDPVKVSDAYTTAPPSAKEVNKSLSGLTAGTNKLNSEFTSSKGPVPSASVNSYNSR